MSFFSLIQEIWCADWLKVTQHLQWTCSPCSFECTSLICLSFGFVSVQQTEDAKVVLTCQEYEKSNLVILYSKLGCRDCCDGMTSVAGKEPAGWIGWIGFKVTNKLHQQTISSTSSWFPGILARMPLFTFLVLTLIYHLGDRALVAKKKTSWSRKRVLYLKKKWISVHLKCGELSFWDCCF